MSPRLRLGVALLVPPPFDRDIDVLRSACGDRARHRIPAHCTLVPPVNVRDDLLVDALEVVRAAAAAARPFSVDLGPPATFLPVNPVLHLPVGGPGVDELHRLRQRVLRPPLERPIRWPFVPHVTLADEMEPDRIAAAVSALADHRLTLTFERVHLMEEHRDRVWTARADVAFGAPAVVGRGGLPVELAVSDGLDAEASAFVEREWPAVAPPGRSRPFVVGARRERAVVGVAEGWTRAGVTRVERLLVAAEHRGQGIGSRLLAAVESLAVERGCPRLSLEAVAGSAADAFYRHRGWVEEGRLTAWVGGADRALLRRDLGP